MVKLPVVWVLTAMLLASAVASAQAIPQALPGGVRDVAIGDGTNSEVAYHFDVRSGPSGEDPSGSASVSGPFVPPFISTQIECLSVSGNTATFVYRMAPTVGLVRVKVTATDNGPVGDTVGSMFYDPSTVPACTPITGFEGNGGQPPGFITGQVVIHDAQPLPTSKDQCKNGGWRTYGVFKNQGDCVSFVATGGKNPPARSP